MGAHKVKTYTDFIEDNLRKGIITWKENLGLFQGKFGLTEQTFDKYWKIAKKKHLQYVENISKESNTELRNLRLKRKKEVFQKSCNELLSIINKESSIEEKCYDFSIGKVVVFKREPSALEIISAIKEYNRINGI